MFNNQDKVIPFETSLFRGYYLYLIERFFNGYFTDLGPKTEIIGEKEHIQTYKYLLQKYFGLSKEKFLIKMLEIWHSEEELKEMHRNLKESMNMRQYTDLGVDERNERDMKISILGCPIDKFIDTNLQFNNFLELVSLIHLSSELRKVSKHNSRMILNYPQINIYSASQPTIINIIERIEQQPILQQMTQFETGLDKRLAEINGVLAKTSIKILKLSN